MEDVGKHRIDISFAIEYDIKDNIKRGLKQGQLIEPL